MKKYIKSSVNRERIWQNSMFIFVIFFIGWTFIFIEQFMGAYYEISSSKESFSFRQSLQTADYETKQDLAKAAQQYNLKISEFNKYIDPFNDAAMADRDEAIEELKKNTDKESVVSLEKIKEDNQKLRNLAHNFHFYGDEVFATMTIPRLNLDLAIYLGASPENLNRGVAIIEGSSLPIGGENCHSVIAGHNNLIHNVLFSDLNELKVGDSIFIESPNGLLEYKMTEAIRLSPQNIDYIDSFEGKDRISLLTCYEGRNDVDRYVVVADRVNAQVESSLVDSQNRGRIEEVSKRVLTDESFFSNLIGFSWQVLLKTCLRILVYILGLVIFVLVLRRIDKKKENKKY